MGHDIRGISDEILRIRRELHQYPELSHQEQRTAELICRELDALGMAYLSGIGGYGVVVDIPGKPGPIVALRADMDALPIDEETGLSFSSRVPGIMHACGHDGHMAMVLGAAMLLGKESALPSPVRLIFQPAEEVALGARAMIDAGVLDDVGVIFGAHLDRHYEVGTIMVTDDYVNAASDRFYIDISGVGGHAARPHEAVDAVIVGTLIVSTIQTIVSREVDPAHPSVITVGKFHAGTAGNVIAGTARLEGSIRSLDPNVRDYLHSAIERICESVGQLHGASVGLNIERGAPSLKNDEYAAGLARESVVAVLGEAGCVSRSAVNMGAEDFAYYLTQVPGAVVRIGAQFPDRESFPAHSSKFDFDEKALVFGARYFYDVALRAGAAIRT